MAHTTLKTNENMKALETAILKNETLKNELQGSCNVNIDLTNKVATLFGVLPQKRVEMWLDSRNVVVFVGSSVKETTVVSEEFKSLFNESLDIAYRISEKIETKHKFSTIESAISFLESLSNRVVKEESKETEKESKKTVKTSKKATSKKTTKKETKTA